MNAGQEINAALDMLGYTDNNGNEQLTRRVMNKAISIVNTVYSDLWGITQNKEFEPVKTLTDEIKLTGRAANAFVYGLAAFLAQGENDSDNQQLWMSIYNGKRAGLSKSDIIIDKIPRSFDL